MPPVTIVQYIGRIGLETSLSHSILSRSSRTRSHSGSSRSLSILSRISRTRSHSGSFRTLSAYSHASLAYGYILAAFALWVFSWFSYPVAFWQLSLSVHSHGFRTRSRSDSFRSLSILTHNSHTRSYSGSFCSLHSPLFVFSHAVLVYGHILAAFALSQHHMRFSHMVVSRWLSLSLGKWQA